MINPTIIILFTLPSLCLYVPGTQCASKHLHSAAPLNFGGTMARILRLLHCSQAEWRMHFPFLELQPVQTLDKGEMGPGQPRAGYPVCALISVVIMFHSALQPLKSPCSTGWWPLSCTLRTRKRLVSFRLLHMLLPSGRVFSHEMALGRICDTSRARSGMRKRQNVI